MQLPSGERAVVDLVKLRRYVLDPYHPRGRHKARVFAPALQLHQSDVDFLRKTRFHAALTGDAVPGETDACGQRYILNSECICDAGRTYATLAIPANRLLPLLHQPKYQAA